MAKDLGIDLGTASVLVYVKGKGIVLNEPSVVAMDKNTGKLLKVGEEARQMLGRTPGNIVAIRPLREGVISDYDMTERMLKEFIRKVAGFMVFKPRVIICVPSGITEVEERAVVDAGIQSGCRRVYLIEEPVAAAIGAGIDITKPDGHMVVDIGGGTSDIAIFADNAIKYTGAVPLGGQNLTNDIAFGLRTPISAAEKIKIKYGCCLGEMVSPDETIEVPSVGGRPSRQVARQVLAAICEPRMEEIFFHINQELERSGYKRKIGAGVVLTGGSSLIEGAQELAEQIFGLPTRIGSPQNLGGGFTEMVSNPKYATAVGLLFYGAENEGASEPIFAETDSDSGVLSKVLNHMKKWFSEIK